MQWCGTSATNYAIVEYSNILLCPKLHGGIPTISGEPQTSTQAWKLIEQDYTLRLSLVANEWATEHLRAWNAVFGEGRRRGNSAYFGSALVRMEIADAEKRAEWAYRTCCEIWEIQGRTKCRPFFRAVFDWCLQPMFSVREGCFRHGLELRQKRTGAKIPQGLSAIEGHMRREMGKLRARWNTILEIATRDAENEERRKREQESKAIQDIRTRSFYERAWESRQSSTPVAARPVVGPLSLSFTWKELEARFREIQAKTSPHQNVHAVFIRTEWDSGSVSEVWIVSGNLALRTEVEHLGSIAARKLGSTSYDNPHEDWLGRVRVWVQQTGLYKDRNYSWPSFGSVNENGMIGKTETISLENLAELSALYCMHLIANGTSESMPFPQHSEVLTSKATPRLVVRKAKVSKKQLRRTEVIFGAIQAGLRGPRYCSDLDGRRLSPPEPWKEDGCPDTYTLAYRDIRWRKRIQDEKHRYGKQYKEASASEREAIIQGKNGTRRTRH